MPWGETRYGGVGTEYQYTGQYRLAALGLDCYGARWYDPSLGRFAQADTVVPLASQGVQAWDRYAGMNNNPVKYNDPSGHIAKEDKVTNDWNFFYWQNEQRYLKAIGQLWFRRLLALTVLSESARGTYPAIVMMMTAHVLLNRLFSGRWNHRNYPEWFIAYGNTALWALIKATQHNLPANYDNSPGGEGWNSNQDMIDWVNGFWDDLIKSPRLGDGLADAYNSVTAAIKMTRDNMIYFSHQTSSKGFESVQERHDWIINSLNVQETQDEDFEGYYYGPFYNPLQGYMILFVASNEPLCGTYGKCR